LAERAALSDARSCVQRELFASAARLAVFIQEINANLHFHTIATRRGASLTSYQGEEREQNRGAKGHGVLHAGVT
jgi:hypothetical protein